MIRSSRSMVRTYYPEVPPRVVYEISELGRSLAPLFAALAQWTSHNMPEVEQARRRFDEAATQPKAAHRP